MGWPVRDRGTGAQDLAMNVAVTGAGSYLELFDYNVTALVQALR